jgi:hypothetical protein
MRISFDLDDTLICSQPDVPREPALPWWLRWLTSGEPLRHGARALLRELRAAGWEVWIYTTSFRDPHSVWLWLACHGVWVGRVINQTVHDQHLRRSGYHPPSKHPGVFGIHLHVDDSEGVRMEGQTHGFEVLVVSPTDLDWANRVRRAAGLAESDSRHHPESL